LPFYGEQKNRKINNYTITAYGDAKNNQTSNEMLFYGFMNPVSQEQCKKAHKGVIDITEKHICVSNTVTGTAPCSGM
jgi:hypothetical protein